MDNEELKLTDLVDVNILQRIQDAFSKMTGIAALTTNADGIPVTNGSNFSEFCMKYTRTSPVGCSRCEKCDKYGAELALKNGRSITYFCHAGLVDFAAPIMADGKMVGCFIGGQVLSEPPSENLMRDIAQQIGVDPDTYVEAAGKVNIIPKENIDHAAEFLYTIASVLSDIAYSRYLVYQANLEIEKAANMKSDFLANMSHEIRTPMNAVIGMAEMALREELPANAREYINEIKSSGKSLLTIINDILDFSKIESGKMNIVPVEYEPMSVINDVSNIVMAQLEDKDVEFILDVDPDIPNCLLGDNNRIKQIILNLTNNAIKFTRKGQVILHFNCSKLNENNVMLKVAIEDTGIGIKKEDMPKLFQSFQQLDSKRNRNIKGTGLGLAICKQLLALMGGSIKVESEYEKGSVFSFELPQKIIDDKECVSLKNDRHIVTAGIVSNPYVKKQLAASIERLGAEYIDLKEMDDLTVLLEKGVSYLWVEASLFTEELKEFAESNTQISMVLITSPKENAGRGIRNIRIVKKPVYVMNIAMIFNDEDPNVDYSVQSAELFDFVAPEAEVLIVDDNAINLTVAQGLLEPLRMRIDTALSGKEAVEKISGHMYDIVFMDHMMPEIDGVETTHIIRRFHKEYDDVPIIALTANAVEGTMEMFLKEGMNDFVAKPIEIRTLVSKVKHWLPPGKVRKDIGHQDSPDAAKENKLPQIGDLELPQIGDLDVEAALGLLGSENLFWSVLKDYYRVIEQKAAHIEQLEKNESWHEYTIEVHALKSASRQIGAGSLADLAALLEKAGNETDAALIHDKTPQLLKQYISYHSVLKPFCEEGRQDDEKKTAASLQEMKTYFNLLRTAMEELDLDSMEETIVKMEKHAYDGESGELFRQLKAAVDNIDVDECENLISMWEEMYPEDEE